MNKDVAELWATRLESGKDSQATGILNRVDSDGKSEGMCCLGVLCEIAVEHGVIPPGQPVPEDVVLGYENADGPIDGKAPYTAVPPQSVIEWAGLDKQLTVVATYTAYDYAQDEMVTQTQKVEFTALNDVYGFTFRQIAEAIRADYLT